MTDRAGRLKFSYICSVPDTNIIEYYLPSSLFLEFLLISDDFRATETIYRRERHYHRRFRTGSRNVDAAFGKALKNNGAIGTDKLENILSAYPDINPVWLLTGNGNMLTSGNPAATAPDAGRSVSPTTVPAGYGNLTYRVIRVNDNRLLYEGNATAPCLTNCRSKRSKLRQRIPKVGGCPAETTADPAPSGRGDRKKGRTNASGYAEKPWPRHFGRGISS